MTRFAIATVLGAAALLAAAPPAVAAWTWPLAGEVITPYRNGDDPYAAGQHRGIDIAGPAGAPVVAAVPGLVRFAGTAGSSGRTVSVRSEDGGFDVSYLHLSSIAVHRGDQVRAGALIGAVGTTGVRSAERTHLHFGVREAGSRHAYLDPLTLLPPPAAPAPRPPQATPVAAPAPARPDPRPVPVPRTPAARVSLPAARRVPAAETRAGPGSYARGVGPSRRRRSHAALTGACRAATEPPPRPRTHRPAPAIRRTLASARVRVRRSSMQPSTRAAAPDRPAPPHAATKGAGSTPDGSWPLPDCWRSRSSAPVPERGGAALRTRVRERASSIAVRCRITSPRRSTT